MMAQQPQMNMAGMGGPVGGAPHMVQMNMGTPSGSNAQSEMITKLNTAIYDYLLRSEHYEAAKVLLKEAPVDTKGLDASPNMQPGQQPNGMDDSADIDSKVPALLQRPEGLPLANNISSGPFLQDWWCQFWETFNAHRNRKNQNSGVGVYINAQRPQMQARMGRMNNLNQNNQNMMAFNNPMMQANGMAMNQDLKRAAMVNNQKNMTPQQLQQMQNMRAAAQNGQMMQAGNQMERSGSQMDNRSGSPGSGDAPSPKRPRLEGGMQQMNQGRPGQPGQMQQGNQSAQIYAASMTKQMEVAREAAMNGVNKSDSNVNKGLPPSIGPGGVQGSPISQAGMDAATGDFYAAANGAGRMPMQNNAAAAAAAAGQAGGNNGSHALQDYQMQLMLLEQQNKKRLLVARQEQDNMTGHPPAPNGNLPPGMSPHGSAMSGSPTPNDLQRGSPTPGNMMDPNNFPPQMRAQMQMMPNGQMMRPPSSHPGANLTPQQLEMMRQGGMPMPNGQFAPGQQPPQGMMPGGQPGQPGQGPQGTPRQATNQMPPPPAPPANASGGPSSPSQAPAPPTPSTTNKAKPGNKKEANKKGAAAKKGGAANATPASEAEPPTPTPATPITPMNPKSFNAAGNGPQLPNGAPAGGPPPQAPNANAPPQPDPSSTEPFGTFDNGTQFNDIDLSFDMNGDSLDNFDFDSFLNQDGDQGLGFDANFAFDGIGASGGGIEGGN